MVLLLGGGQRSDSGTALVPLCTEDGEPGPWVRVLAFPAVQPRRLGHSVNRPCVPVSREEKRFAVCVALPGRRDQTRPPAPAAVTPRMPADVAPHHGVPGPRAKSGQPLCRAGAIRLPPSCRRHANARSADAPSPALRRDGWPLPAEVL